MCVCVCRGRGAGAVSWMLCMCMLSTGVEGSACVWSAWPTLMCFLLNQAYKLVSWSTNLTSRGTTVYRRYTTREKYMYNYNPCHF